MSEIARRLMFGDNRLPEFFWQRAHPIPVTGCWLWSGAVRGSGYSAFRRKYGHRAAVEAERGPIPEGMQVDHLCRVRSCVNPEHLDVVTARENLLRGDTVTARSASVTHCPQGHAREPLR